MKRVWCMLMLMSFLGGMGIISCGGSDATETSEHTITAPSATDIRTALGLKNTYGMVPGLSLGETILPAFTTSNGSVINFSITMVIEDLPSWLTFNPSTRGITLTSGSTVPDDALTKANVAYVCTDDSDSAIEDSVSFVVNDLDGGGMTDGAEYQSGAVPLQHPTFGYIKLTPGDENVYRSSAVARIPTSIVKVTTGLNPAKADDDTTDLDGDGTTNKDDANPFIATSNGAFGSKTDFTTGTRPRVIATGDFNNDGKLDLAVTNSGIAATGTTFSVFLGNGNGTFASKSDFTVGSGPFAIVAADFSNDGNLDLAVSNNGSGGEGTTISVLVGNGAGSFASKTDYTTGTGPSGLAAADFNNDGKVDVVVSNSGTDSSAGSTMSYFPGNGDGTLGTRRDITTERGPRGISTADFNGDGKLDIAIAHLGTNASPNMFVSIMLGNGDGTFGTRTDYTTGSGPTMVSIADFNGDRKLDLVVSNSGGNSSGSTMSILLGKGDGTFNDKTDSTTGTTPMGIALADLDGDGDVDVAIPNLGPSATGTTLSILLGNGDGTFASKTDYTTGTGPVGIAGGDFDADGDIDLAVTNFGSGIGAPGSTMSIFLNE